MADEASGFLSQIAADPKKTGDLIGSLTAKNAGTLQTYLSQQLRASNEVIASWAESFSQNILRSQTVMVGFQGASKKAFDELSAGMTKHIAHTALYSQSIGDAMQKALKSTLAAITSEAVVRAIYNAGLGFYFLAVQAYDQAAKAFEAAAVFGSVAGASGLMGAMAGGGVAGAAGASAASGGEFRTEAGGSPLAGTSGVPVSSLAPGSAARPSGQLTVMVVGPSDAAHWLSQEVLNPYVEAGGTLKSSQSMRSPYAGG